jgi:hypothetical protein
LRIRARDSMIGARPVTHIACPRERIHR